MSSDSVILHIAVFDRFVNVASLITFKLSTCLEVRRLAQMAQNNSSCKQFDQVTAVSLCFDLSLKDLNFE